MRIGAYIAVGLVAVALAGCAPDVPEVTVPPTPGATPLFASDEEALAAAEEAYAAYLAMSDEILRDGGENPERLRTVTTQAFYDDELAGFSEAAESGVHSVGDSTLSNVVLQSYDENGVVAYVCEDVSAVDVVDVGGVSVVSPSRPDKTAFEVTLVAGADALLVSQKLVWDGGGVC